MSEPYEDYDEAQAIAAAQCKCCQGAHFSGVSSDRCLRCGHEKTYHQLTEAESRVLGEWLNSEEGRRARLQRRKDQMTELVGLGSPSVILAAQEGLIRKTEEELGDPPGRAWTCTAAMHGRLLAWDGQFGEWRCTGCGHRVGKAYGDKPGATRYKPPWMWRAELRNRRRAVVQPGQVPPWFESSDPRPDI
jgi:hypothetical protein